MSITGTIGHAQQLSSLPSRRDLSHLTIEELLQIQVIAPTKAPEPIREAPSIVSVITRDDIRLWGFNSVADALVLVPGIYCVNDYLATDCGVRGLMGGQRGYSKNLKIMIDGQPVSFRSDTTSYLGPELIPIELVETIEVVRGPVSALYGENAFFGAINVITRQHHAGTTVGGRVRVNDDAGGGINFTYIGGGENWSAAVGASGARDNYDGRRLPKSSPNFAMFEEADNLTSRKARSRPVSVFGNGRLRAGAFQSELLARYSQLRTVAEFIDFGTLTHENLIALYMLDTRAQGEWTPSPWFSLSASLGYAKGGPSADERLSTGSAQSYPKREFGYNAIDAVALARVRLFADDWLTLGIDGTRDREDLMQVFAVDRQSGQATRTSAEAGSRDLTNVGFYGQGVVHPVKALGLVGNLRHDRHNIYGGHTNFRTGAVWTPTEVITSKLLFGTSYKAPAALQLFAQPLFPGEAIGNEALKPETARVLEAELLWRPLAAFIFTATGFVSLVHDKVELRPVVANLQPTNTGRQKARGVEIEARWNHWHHFLHANFAYQHTDTLVADPFFGEIPSPSERYPRIESQVRWQYRHDVWGTPGIAVRYASQRRASVSNIRENRLSPYELASYVEVDLAYFKSWGPHAVQIRLDNVLDANNAEPGFGGVDVPRRGRHVWLSYSFGL